MKRIRTATESILRGLVLVALVAMPSAPAQAQDAPPASLYLPHAANDAGGANQGDTTSGATQAQDTPSAPVELQAEPQEAAQTSSGSDSADLIAVPISEQANLALFGKPKEWRPSFATTPAMEQAADSTIDSAAGSDAASAERSPLLPPADSVEWNNDEAGFCSGLFGAGLLSNSVASFLIPPPFDLAPTLAAHTANIMLLYCGPVVHAPPPVKINPEGDECAVEIEMPIDTAAFGNFMGVPLPNKTFTLIPVVINGVVVDVVFAPGSWGDLGTPRVYQFDTTVLLSIQHNGTPVSGVAGRYSLPVGYNNILWRGETLASPADFVPVYIPGLGYRREDKILRRVLQVFAKGGVALTAMFTAEPFGPYNDQLQSIAVTDYFPPVITGNGGIVTVQASEPGGITGSKAISQARARLQVSDHCNRHVTLSPSATPNFWAIGDRRIVTWAATDPGPNASGQPNVATANQTVVVTDTLAPVLVAPPPIVVESPTNSTYVRLGGPQVFDLADLVPNISNNALSLPNVISDSNGIQFPKGKTLITWSAQDVTGNSSQAMQLVNIKGIGENRAPVAQNASEDVVSFEPVEITLHASDVDDDPLWFAIDDNPQHGFFVAPLLPYFIDDYRITSRYSPPIAARDGEAKALEAAASAQAMREYVIELCEEDIQRRDLPKDFVWLNNSFKGVAVDDDGYTYFYDLYYDRCTHGGSTISPTVEERLSLWDPQGRYVGQTEASSSNPVTDIKFDLNRGYIFVVTNNSASNFSYITIYRIDKSNPAQPFTVLHSFDMMNEINRGPANRVIQFFDANSAVLDSNNVLYVLSRPPSQGLGVFHVKEDPENPGSYLDKIDYVTHLVENLNNREDETGLDIRFVNNLALDSQNNVYVSAYDERDDEGRIINAPRIYKFAAATIDDEGTVHAGELIGWMGKCDRGSGCNHITRSSTGYSCTDETCFIDEVADGSGNLPGQFGWSSGTGGTLAIDPNDILYVADGANRRVQRFTPQGFFGGQAVSECDGSCFVLGDFGSPNRIAVNSDHFYVLDEQTELVHVFQTTAVTPLPDGQRARVTYQSDNNYVGADQFTFAATDGLDDDNGTVTIQVSRNSRAPIANPFLAYTLQEDTSVDMTLEGEDPDGPLDDLTYRIVRQPENGKITGNSSANRTYTPDKDFAGADSFQYVVEDGIFTSESATVTLTVINVNDPPVVTLPPGFETGLGFTTLLSGTVSDADGDTLYLTVDWGDGTEEHQGVVDDDNGLTGPVLNQSLDGHGQFFGAHTYTSAGQKSVEVCVEDNAKVVDGVTVPQGGVKACASMVITVRAKVDLTVQLLESNDPVVAGTPMTYRYVVVNRAPEGAPGIAATDISLVGQADSKVQVRPNVPSTQGNCSRTSIGVNCQLGTLEPGDALTVTVDVNLRAAAVPGVSLLHTVTVEAAQPNHNEDNGAIASTAVVAPADLIVNRVFDDAEATCAVPGGPCSLRKAIQAANSTPGMQRIALSDEAYPLGEAGVAQPQLIAMNLVEANEATSEVLEVTDDAQIIGLGALTTSIYGDQTARLFVVRAGATLTLTDLSLSGGSVSGMGGAIQVDGGDLVLQRVSIYDSAATDGGAIANDGGTVIAEESAIFGNQATGRGGALFNQGGTVELRNVTVSSNIADAQGGGLYSTGSLNLRNVTVVSNRSAAGAGVSNDGGSARLSNSLLAANRGAEGGAEDGGDCAGPLASDNHNLIGDSSGCSFGAKSQDRVDQDARVGALMTNGGATPTHALLGGSPARDAGSCALEIDQRGVRRPQEGDCDIGAFETREGDPGTPSNPGSDGNSLFLPSVARR